MFNPVSKSVLWTATSSTGNLFLGLGGLTTRLRKFLLEIKGWQEGVRGDKGGV